MAVRMYYFILLRSIFKLITYDIIQVVYKWNIITVIHKYILHMYYMSYIQECSKNIFWTPFLCYSFLIFKFIIFKYSCFENKNKLPLYILWYYISTIRVVSLNNYMYKTANILYVFSTMYNGHLISPYNIWSLCGQ